MNILHIGSGNIGKGLIFPVLQESNQITSFTFLDIDTKMINFINELKTIEINFFEDSKNTKKKYTNYQGFTFNEILKSENSYILEKIDMITISIGQENLIHIVDSMKKILDVIKKPIIIMCCENGYKVSSYFQQLLKINQENIYFVDCIIDRIIPNQLFYETKIINTENYYSWICDESQWPSTIQKINTLKYTKNIDNEIYIKMCMLNGVHSALAWHRFMVDEFIQTDSVCEALQIVDTKIFISKYLAEMAEIISKKLNVDYDKLHHYGETVIKRFMNPCIDDKLSRVGRNPITKLNSNERVASPLLYAINNNMNCSYLKIAFKNGLLYSFKQDQQAVLLNKDILNFGIIYTLNSHFNFTADEVNNLKNIF